SPASTNARGTPSPARRPYLLGDVAPGHLGRNPTPHGKPGDASEAARGNRAVALEIAVGDSEIAARGDQHAVRRPAQRAALIGPEPRRDRVVADKGSPLRWAPDGVLVA